MLCRELFVEAYLFAREQLFDRHRIVDCQPGECSLSWIFYIRHDRPIHYTVRGTIYRAPTKETAPASESGRYSYARPARMPTLRPFRFGWRRGGGLGGRAWRSDRRDWPLPARTGKACSW